MSQLGLSYIRVNLYVITKNESLIWVVNLVKDFLNSAAYY